MCLKTQFVVVCGKLLQSVRQAAAVEDSGGTIGRLPKTIDCHEKLARIASLLSQLAGARVGAGCLGRLKPLGREKREASGHLQLDFAAFPTRPFSQRRQCCQPALEMTDRFKMGRARRGMLASLEPFIDRTLGITSPSPMMRQEFGLALDQFWEGRLQ